MKRECKACNEMYGALQAARVVCCLIFLASSDTYLWNFRPCRDFDRLQEKRSGTEVLRCLFGRTKPRLAYEARRKMSGIKSVNVHLKYLASSLIVQSQPQIVDCSEELGLKKIQDCQRPILLSTLFLGDVLSDALSTMTASTIHHHLAHACLSVPPFFVRFLIGTLARHCSQFRDTYSYKARQSPPNSEI